MVHHLSALVVVMLPVNPVFKPPLLILIIIHGFISARRCGYFRGQKSVVSIQELDDRYWKLERKEEGESMVARLEWYFASGTLIILGFNRGQTETLILTSQDQGRETLRRLRLSLPH